MDNPAQTQDNQAQDQQQQQDQSNDQNQQQQAQDQQQGTLWYSDMPQDFKDNPNIQKFKTKEDLAKSYLELSSLLGHEKIALPKDENDQAAIAMLNRALGVPDAADGYDLGEAQDIEGFEGIQFGGEQFKEMAFKHKLTPSQASGLQADYIAMIKGIQENAVKDFQTNLEAAKADLTKEWGMAYETKVKLAQDVMNKFTGSKEAFDHINAKLGSDPVALKFLAKVGESFSEGSLGNLGTPASGFTKTPAEAMNEYNQIMNDPNDIYWSGVRNSVIVSEPVRKERIAYVENLLRMAQPAGQA